MKPGKLHFRLFAIAIAVMLATSSYVARDLSHGKPVLRKQVGKTVQSQDDDDLPLVDTTEKKAKDLSTEHSQKEHAKRYGKIGIKISDDTDRISYNNETEWLLRDPLLVKLANVVLMGKVQEVEAVLADDYSAVYSEFKIVVEKVFKFDESPSIARGVEIIVERLGGRVKLLSGKIIVERVVSTRMPLKDSRYLLFLTRNPEDQSLYIISGFYLKNGTVEALDPNPAQRSNPYNGKPEQTLLTDVQAAISTSDGAQ